MAMMSWKEFLLEVYSDEDLKGLMGDLQNLGYEGICIGIHGTIVEDFDEGTFRWRVTASGKGQTKEEALLRAISVAVECIEGEGGHAFLRKGRGIIDISHEVLQKAIRDKQIYVEEIDYRAFMDGKLTVDDLPLPSSWEKDVVGKGYAERIEEWE
jgi:hypothetical protein